VRKTLTKNDPVLRPQSKAVPTQTSPPGRLGWLPITSDLSPDNSSNGLLLSKPAWSVDVSLVMLTICASRKTAHSLARSVTSSPSHYAGDIIASCIVMGTNQCGGRKLESIRAAQRGRCGSKPIRWAAFRSATSEPGEKPKQPRTAHPLTSLRQIEATGGPPLKGTREISSLCEQHAVRRASRCGRRTRPSIA
jgi:hypothetical protein